MLTVLTGPPCGGKTTHAEQHRDILDLVVDLDALAAALGYPEPQVEWESSHPAVVAARAARAHVINALLNRRIIASAWVIDAAPDRAMLAQYQRAGARIQLIDPGREVCLARAGDRPRGTVERIEAWYAARGARRTGSSAVDVFSR